MLAGHYTTALVAKQHVPRGHLAYYLVASQLPDLLWLPFHYLGLEHTQPDNVMAVSLDNMHVDMTYSHDLLPILGWIALVVLVGRALFGAWRPGLVGGALVVVHALTDYVGGFPHNLFGPDTHAVGTGMYHTAPYLAVSLEAVFTVAVMAWVLRNDVKAGIRRSRATWTAWAMVFGGGLAFLFLSASQSLSELTGIAPSASMADTTVPMLGLTYLAMLGGLLWADTKPTQARTPSLSQSAAE